MSGTLCDCLGGLEVMCFHTLPCLRGGALPAFCAAACCESLRSWPPLRSWGTCMLCVAVATQAARPEHGLGKDFSDADGANSALWLGGGTSRPVPYCTFKTGRTAQSCRWGLHQTSWCSSLPSTQRHGATATETQASEPQCQVGCEAVTKMVESFVLAASAGLSLHSSFSACAR